MHSRPILPRRWRSEGLDREPVEFRRPREPNTGVDYLSQQDESYGRDVGCQLPLCLLREKGSASDPSSLSPEVTAAAGAARSAAMRRGSGRRRALAFGWARACALACAHVCETSSACGA